MEKTSFGPEDFWGVEGGGGGKQITGSNGIRDIRPKINGIWDTQTPTPPSLPCPNGASHGTVNTS